MRNAAPLVCLVSIGLWPVAGCARPQVTSVTPTDDELPHIEQPGRVLPVSVGVEGRGEEPTVMLVPSFPEPELTPEERAALGEKPELINWLEFYQPLPKIQRVGPDTGGVATGIHGLGGPAVGLASFQRPSAVGGWSSPLQGVYTGRDTRYARGGRSQPAADQGPASGVGIGVNPARRVASHQTRPEP